MSYSRLSSSFSLLPRWKKICISCNYIVHGIAHWANLMHRRTSSSSSSGEADSDRPVRWPPDVSPERPTESLAPQSAPDGGQASTRDNRSPNAYLDEYLPLLSLSPRTQGLGQLIQEVARTDATVLVRGESGVGKNLVARAIHAMSPRRDKPFVLVNCAALPAEQIGRASCRERVESGVGG